MDEQAIYERYRERMLKIGVPPASFDVYMKATSQIATISGFLCERQHRRFVRGRETDDAALPLNPVARVAGVALFLLALCGIFLPARQPIDDAMAHPHGDAPRMPLERGR